MDKLKAFLKALLFGLIMCLFIVVSAFIAKGLKLSANRAYVFQGCFILLSVLIPLLYAGSKEMSGADLGLNKPTKKAFKSVLFYLPFLVALIPLIIVFNKNGSIKSMVVALFYYGCIAIASEIYFRGLIQGVLRKHFSIIPLVVICGLMFAGCFAYYAVRLTNIKHIAILVVGAAAYSGVATMAIEAKGNILFLIVVNALYFFLTACYDLPGKKLVLGQGICLTVLFVYGVYMLIKYFKENKKDEPQDLDEPKDNQDEFNEEGNIDLV